MSLRKTPISKSCRIKVGITIGDPSGIGPFITIKAVNQLPDIADLVIIGDSSLLSKIPGFRNLKKRKIRVVDLKNVAKKGFKPGKVKAEYGKASIEYLDRAVRLIKAKELDCLVTAPISKEAINLAGFDYSGHTEYFARKTNSKDLVMMLLNKHLRFSLVTRHIRLKDVPGQLSINRICQVTRVTYSALKNIFGISYPKIVICGLNPHASDNGLIGTEERTILSPAVKKLSSELAGITGPLPSDIAIVKALKKEFDAAIVMYHDQALIPLKITGMDGGVNITLGLEFVRTSPLHGTAFDIARTKGPANCNSMISAIRLALKCASIQRKD